MRLLRPPQRDLQEAAEYARENGVIYMETSAKSGMNVKLLFDAIGAWCLVSVPPVCPSASALYPLLNRIRCVCVCVW